MMYCEQLKCPKSFPWRFADIIATEKSIVVMEPNFDIIIPDSENYTLLGNMLTDSPDHIIGAIFGNDEIMRKCENNRFWLEEMEYMV